MKRYIFRLCALSSLLIVACSLPPIGGEHVRDGGSVSGDLAACDPAGDEDLDGISNGDEGCLEGRDTDGDGIPDWEDLDSDGDRIGDDIELGVEGACLGPRPERWPCDSDGDGAPDYLDTDSDNDGLADGLEDVNGDGLLGCCLRRCGVFEGYQHYYPRDGRGCPLNAEQCGRGQRCEAGLCRPPRAFSCSDGETDPRVAQTFGQGAPDLLWGSFVCRDATQEDQRGAKAIQIRGAGLPHSEQGWHGVFEQSARFEELDLDSDTLLRGGVVDYLGASEGVTGFIVSLPGRRSTLRGEVEDVLDALYANAPVGLTQVKLIDDGQRVATADDYEQRRGMWVELSGSGADLGVIRHGVARALLGHPPLGKTDQPRAVGLAAKRAVLRLSVLRQYWRRTDDTTGRVLRDAQGIALERAGAEDQRRVVVVGAFARASEYRDIVRATGIRVDDLVMGNAVVEYFNHTVRECDVFELDGSEDGPPLRLEFSAASVSLTVAFNGIELPRSRERGFDYDPLNNALILHLPQGWKRGYLVVSYQHWVRSHWE